MARAQGEISRLVLHLIGPLQTNKAREAWRCSMSSSSTGNSPGSGRRNGKAGPAPACFASGQYRAEPQRPGSGSMKRPISSLARTPMGSMLGLMHPLDRPPGRYFAQLAGLAERRGSKLSMGMSADFETAISWGRPGAGGLGAVWRAITGFDRLPRRRHNCVFCLMKQTLWFIAFPDRTLILKRSEGIGANLCHSNFV